MDIRLTLPITMLLCKGSELWSEFVGQLDKFLFFNEYSIGQDKITVL
jgi:hypothetical protein